MDFGDCIDTLEACLIVLFRESGQAFPKNYVIHPFCTFNEELIDPAHLQKEAVHC
jgi:hypothetical protein